MKRKGVDLLMLKYKYLITVFKEMFLVKVIAKKIQQVPITLTG